MKKSPRPNFRSNLHSGPELALARPMAIHLDYGKKTEELALEWFLNRFPARLVAKNYRCKMGELDLVFEQTDELGKELVFVEVRARQAGGWVNGVESIGPKKVRRLRKAIGHFLVFYEGRAERMRVDVMAWNGAKWTHLQNVWI